MATISEKASCITAHLEVDNFREALINKWQMTGKSVKCCRKLKNMTSVTHIMLMLHPNKSHIFFRHTCHCRTKS